MLSVYLLLLPIFVVILLGFAAVRTGLFPADGLPHLNRFVLVICVPVLIFSALMHVGSLSGINWGFVGIYAGVALTLNLIAGTVLRLGLGFSEPAAGMLALGAGTANSIFLGYPIALLVFPEDAAILFAWIIMADAFLGSAPAECRMTP